MDENPYRAPDEKGQEQSAKPSRTQIVYGVVGVACLVVGAVWSVTVAVLHQHPMPRAIFVLAAIGFLLLNQFRLAQEWLPPK